MASSKTTHKHSRDIRPARRGHRTVRDRVVRTWKKSASKISTVLILGALLACQQKAAAPFYDLIENLPVAEVGEGLPAPRALAERLFLPFESRVGYYLRLFPGSTLAVEHGRGRGRGRGKLRVTIEHRDGRIETEDNGRPFFL